MRKKASTKIEWDCIYNKPSLHLINPKPKVDDVIEGKKIEKIEDKGDHYLIKWYER